ncbi:sensor histidine kinase [Thermophilibacter provencensis]|uniref:histidine kinase n=1 Tax=Thermophilibacter provencensis TaxID=1852386 RepID=A0ABT7V0I1_9ACTN|nr:HAMP domain-containing sensor histidine kinase [Thermophilibacter provencensis]MDM8270083.1 HAMP domain-containing sensor histidine kinase [Thermophilibacter provencensis]
MSASEKSGGARSIVLTVAMVAGAILVASAAFYTVFGFVDKAWNGSFMDWLAPQILNTNNLNEFGIWPEMVLDVSGIKYFFLQLGICGIVLLAVGCAAAAVLSARRARREERARAAELLRVFLDHDLEVHEAFPAGWEELALVASDAKRAAAEKERQLADESARRSDLVTYLAHDLKTPLTSVIGYLSLLDEVPDMPDAQRARYTGVALDKACRLERLVNEFFDITRYSLTHIELELAPVDLAGLLVQLADEFYPALAAHGNVARVTVEGSVRTVEEPGEPLMVTADAARLARVFGNLLRNAIAYSDEGTPVEVGAVAGEGSVVVTVSDTGATIPSHKLRAIFDRFFRLDESRGSATGGAGLGLAIAREIVELHGGSISAASENGRTTFTVELPLSH